MTKGDQEMLFGDSTMQKTFWRPGFRPGPRGGSLQHSADSLAGGKGGWLPLPKNPTPTVDHSVKRYIDETLPALLEKSGNLVLWKVDTLNPKSLTLTNPNPNTDPNRNPSNAKLTPCCYSGPSLYHNVA